MLLSYILAVFMHTFRQNRITSSDITFAYETECELWDSDFQYGTPGGGNLLPVFIL